MKEVQIDSRIKIAALWIALMFSYVYNDFFYLYKPGAMEHMLDGKMGPFPVSQMSLLLATILMTVPTLMIFLSLVLPVQFNRWTNIIVSILYIVVAIQNTIGEYWAFYIFGNVVEVLFLLLIAGYAWKYPKMYS